MAAQRERIDVVDGMTREHRERAVRGEGARIGAIEVVALERNTGRRAVRGDGIDDRAVRAALATASDDVARAGR